MRTQVRRAREVAARVIAAVAVSLVGVTVPARAQSAGRRPGEPPGDDPAAVPTSQFSPLPLMFAVDAPTPRQPGERENNGEDETRPLTCVDFRPRNERLSDGRDTCMLTPWSAADITYDFRSRHWFVPADVTIGRRFSRNLVTAIEVEVSIVRDLDLYRLKLEPRISFFF